MVTIVKDKELIWDLDDYDVILVGTTTYAKLDAGFQSKIRFKYPIVDEKNNKMPYADTRRLGTRLTFEEFKPIISLLYICGYPTKKSTTLDYKALENCMATVNAEFKGKRVATTVLGGTVFDGNGDKTKCLEIMEKNSPDINLFIYDYEQLSRKDEIDRQKRFISSFRHTDYEKYRKLKENEENLLKQLYLC